MKIINGLDPYSRIELVDEREYQKVQMKPTNDEIISERKKKWSTIERSKNTPKISLEVIFIEKITEFRLHKSFECIVSRHGPHGPGCKPTLHIIRRKL